MWGSSYRDVSPGLQAEVGKVWPPPRTTLEGQLLLRLERLCTTMDISCHDCRLRKGNATVLTGATIFDRSSGEHLTVAEGWDGKEGLATAVISLTM